MSADLTPVPRLFGFVKARPRLYRSLRSAYRLVNPDTRSAPPEDLVNRSVRIRDLATARLAESDPGCTVVAPLSVDGTTAPVRTVPPWEWHVASVDGAHVFDGEAVVSADGSWIRDVTHVSADDRPDGFPVGAVKRGPRRVGEAVMLSCYAGRGYYHWLFDVLPRLALFERAGIDLGSVDTILVSGMYAGFQRDTLAHLGIPEERVLSVVGSRHVEAARLWVASHPRWTGGNPEWAIRYLRSAFPPVRPENPPGRRIVISRAKTHHGRFDDEAATAALVERGFQSVALEDYSLSEKAWVFGNAEVVVGDTGAGLSHVVFSGPGTALVELRSRGASVSAHYWDVCSRVGAAYWYVDHRAIQENRAAAIAATLDAVLAG